MKTPAMLIVLFCSMLSCNVHAEEKSCATQMGKKQSEMLVKWCINVSPATHPPCNSANACNLITDEIKRGCALLKNEKNLPYYCLLTYQN
jgi:hypothetical protein